MNSTAAYSAYQQNNISIESPQKLVQMMYEGILRFNTNAKRAILSKDIEKRTYWINRSTAIFAELINSLDAKRGGGDVSDYLEGLYTYQVQLLAESNVENSSEKIDTVNNVVKGLLEAWREVTTSD